MITGMIGDLLAGDGRRGVRGTDPLQPAAVLPKAGRVARLGTQCAEQCCLPRARRIDGSGDVGRVVRRTERAPEIAKPEARRGIAYRRFCRYWGGSRTFSSWGRSLETVTQRMSKSMSK